MHEHEGGIAVKILAKFLLSSVFVFLPAVGYAQDDFNLLLRQINKVQRELDEKQFELEMKLGDQQKDIQDLAKRQDALDEALKNAKFDIEFLKSMRGFADTKTDDTRNALNSTMNKLYETEHRLTKAEETIDTLNLRLSALEARASKPKAAATKPKTPVNNPTPAVRVGTH